MAGDIAGMTSQFAVNDVSPRATTGSAVNDMLINSTGMSQNPSDPRVGSMINAIGGGPGDSYTQASQQLANLAKQTMLAAAAVEFATLAGRALRGEYGTDERARLGAEQRMDEIAVQTGYGKGYRGEIKFK